MKCQKFNGNMEINRIRTHPVWVDELDHVPDPEQPLGPTIAYVCRDCGYIEFYREKKL